MRFYGHALAKIWLGPHPADESNVPVHSARLWPNLHPDASNLSGRLAVLLLVAHLGASWLRDRPLLPSANCGLQMWV